MGTRMFRLLLVGVLAVSVMAARPAKQSAVVTFTTQTMIAGAAALGTVLFEHDDARMARGEPCTTVYTFDPATNARGDTIVAFMCLPRERPASSKFEAICSRASIGGPDRLVEYQFAGDHEAHGVPLSK